MSDTQYVFSLQKKIFKGLERELSLIERNKNTELLRYESRYNRQFKNKFQLVERSSLIEHCRGSNFIFFGDYHPFYQSQRTAIRLLEQMKPRLEHFVFGLECVFAEFQAALDHFLARDITIGELRETIDYDNRWPFPWENYKGIFLFALENKIPLLALNIKPSNTRTALAERDQAAADIIFKYETKEAKASSTYFIFYGDLHLAKKHLPRRIEKHFHNQSLPYKATYIYQNESSLYWKFVRAKKHLEREVIQLSKDSFCIMNSVPWVKLRSYLDWLDGSAATEEDDFSTDLSSKILEFSEYLRNFLQFRTDIDADYTIHSFDNSEPLKKFTKKPSLHKHKRQLLSYAMNRYRPLILRKEKLIYVPSSSLNVLGELAAHTLFFSLHPDAEVPLNPKQEFHRFILHYLRAYFGSKLLNPKRKCNELVDLKQSTNNIPSDSERFRIFQLALQKTEDLWGKKNVGKRHRKARLNSILYLEAARCVGFLLGERLYYSIQSKRCKLEDTLFLFESHSASEEAAIVILQNTIRNCIGSARKLPGKREKF